MEGSLSPKQSAFQPAALSYTQIQTTRRCQKAGPAEVAGSDRGGERAAAMYSLIETAKFICAMSSRALQIMRSTASPVCRPGIGSGLIKTHHRDPARRIARFAR